MQAHFGLPALEFPPGKVVLTIGNFDGVHRGHQALMRQVVESAKENSKQSVVLTFDPHPSKILRPDAASPRLFSLEENIEQLRELGLDHVVVVPFTSDFARLSAEDFIRDFIWRNFHPFEVIVGYDFAFGRERKGSFELLKKFGAEFGFRCRRLDPVLIDGQIASSSALRECLTSGDVEKVSSFLGRPFTLVGEVRRGEGRGHKLGFSTANLQPDAEILPANGVYVTCFILDGREYPSVTNIGHKPTFHDSFEVTVETHVLEPSTVDFYGRRVKVAFLRRLRPELKFPSAHELIEQIAADVEAAKRHFGMD